MDTSARAVTGKGGLRRGVEFAGRTDRQIARALLRAGGNADPDSPDIDRLIEGYLSALAEGVEQRPYRPIPSVRDAVVALRARGATVALGTGNVRRGARIKLTSAGLIDLFESLAGGFGDDGETRAELLRVGAERCDPSGGLPVVIVGDTPHDIEAARAIGARSVAVTTGPCDAASLRVHAPDLLLDHVDATLPERVDELLR